MLKHILIILILALTQSGCSFQVGDRYPVADLSPEERAEAEREKRELIQIEDIKIGEGPVAAWGRKISADVEIRSADYTLFYRGKIWTYYGFKYLPEAGITHDRFVGLTQPGIRLGLNGMRVGGKRRITIDRKLVCIQIGEDAGPRATCPAVGPNGTRGAEVRKEKLVVEATLTASCTPVKLMASIYWVGVNFDVWCRDEAEPRFDPKLPVWHFY